MHYQSVTLKAIQNIVNIYNLDFDLGKEEISGFLILKTIDSMN